MDQFNFMERNISGWKQLTNNFIFSLPRFEVWDFGGCQIVPPENSSLRYIKFKHDTIEFISI